MSSFRQYLRAAGLEPSDARERPEFLSLAGMIGEPFGTKPQTLCRLSLAATPANLGLLQVNGQSGTSQGGVLVERIVNPTGLATQVVADYQPSFAPGLPGSYTAGNMGGRIFEPVLGLGNTYQESGMSVDYRTYFEPAGWVPSVRTTIFDVPAQGSFDVCWYVPPGESIRISNGITNSQVIMTVVVRPLAFSVDPAAGT